MRESLSTCRRVCSFLLALSLSVTVAAAVELHTYEEDFTTHDYRDQLNTTLDWDTDEGQIRLFPFELSIVGGCDPPDWDYAYQTAIAGDFAFLADRNFGLRVVDISEPTDPIVVGGCETPNGAYGVAVEGDHAFMATWSGIEVISIAEPTEPLLVGSCATIDAAMAITIAGDYAYAAVSDSGLQVIDISEPTEPVAAGNCPIPPLGTANRVVIAGDYAYLAAGDFSGLQVIDISDPENPGVVASYETPYSIFDVAISGDHAFVTDQYVGLLQVIDISEPTEPITAGSCTWLGAPLGVSISGDYAYVADHAFGIRVIDIHEPTNPTLVRSCETPNFPHDVTIAGDHAYLTTGYTGLHVIDIADPEPPSAVGSWPTPGWAYGVAVAGDYAYLASHDAGLKVIDIKDPTNPYSEDNWVEDTSDWARDVVISGDYAYVADQDRGLRVIEITDPTSPRSDDDWICTTGAAHGVTLAGDYAYVAAGTHGLEVIDITEPTSPQHEASCHTFGHAKDVAVSGNYAYLATLGFGLQVIDITEPTSPQHEASCPTPGYSYGVAIAGDFAYVADSSYGLQVIDIRTPTEPELVARCDTPGSVTAVTISGDYALVTDATHGIQVIDIRIPTEPQLVVGCDTPGYAVGLTVAGNHVYVADMHGGLQVIEILQHTIDTDANVAQSLDIESADEGAIIRVKLTADQTGSITWWLSANGGHSWQEYLLESPRRFQRMWPRGNELLWKSNHLYTGGGVNPTCTDLGIQWLYRPVLLLSIDDIPGDQGGRVRLEFERSGLDFDDEPDEPIDTYKIWRRIGGGALKSATGATGGQEGNEWSLPPGTWVVIGEVSAAQQDVYIYEASTVADSTETGVIYTVYCVTAHTTTPSVWYASLPDSGYSVDNITPETPTGFAVDYNAPGGNRLTWDTCPDEDFQCFRVYRDESQAFEPSPANLVHAAVETSWLDTEGTSGHHYKLCTVDDAGNESNPALPGELTGVEDALPSTFALQQNIPNPAGPGTSISYDVPVGASVIKLYVFDVAGRLVRRLVDGEETPGRKRVDWDGTTENGERVPAGVYYFRLEADAEVLTRKTILLE